MGVEVELVAARHQISLKRSRSLTALKANVLRSRALAHAAFTKATLKPVISTQARKPEGNVPAFEITAEASNDPPAFRHRCLAPLARLSLRDTRVFPRPSHHMVVRQPKEFDRRTISSRLPSNEHPKGFTSARGLACLLGDLAFRHS